MCIETVAADDWRKKKDELVDSITGEKLFR